MIAILKVSAITFLTVACLVITCLSAKTSNNDLDLLNGEWQAQSLEIEGESASPEAVKSIQVTIKNDRMVVRLDTEYYRAKEAVFKIDSTKSPKHIDISPIDEQSKFVSGIYEAKNESLKVCLNLNSNAKRPDKFEAKPDSGRVLIVFKKLKQ